MEKQQYKSFWDIEKEKTWRIYFLFGFLLFLYFIPIYVIWILIKLFIYIRFSLVHNIDAPFTLFGFDTWIVLIIAAVASYIHWFQSNSNVVRRALDLLGAKHPDRYDQYHQVFENVVDEVSTAAGGIEVERYILPTGAMNAFALADLSGKNVIGITEGLLSRLNRYELQSVVAHEMAHIVSKDSLLTTIVCALFGIYSEALAQSNRLLISSAHYRSPVFDEATQQNFATVGLLSAPVAVLMFFASLGGQLLNMFISRQKEYRADASAIKYTRNPLSLASALYKIGTRWRGAGYGGEYLSPIFILSPQGNQLDEQENFWADLFSTHPPLMKRLGIILNIGHASISEITQRIGSEKVFRSEVEFEKPVVKYYAEHQGQWEGPYTVSQLQVLEWLEPETRLKLDASGEVVEAGNLPELYQFFKNRDKAMWKMKRLCPDCVERLVVQEYEGLYIWHCAFCMGSLVEKDKLPRIFVRKEKNFKERIRRIAGFLKQDSAKKHPNLDIMLDMSHPRLCPKCGQKMIHKFYSYAYHVEVDECSVCKLIWFDPDELEVLQCLIEMSKE